MACKTYPHAHELLITAAGGGSNESRTRLTVMRRAVSHGSSARPHLFLRDSTFAPLTGPRLATSVCSSRNVK